MRFFSPGLLRLSSAAAIVFGIMTGQAAAAERIDFGFDREREVQSWSVQSGNWAVRNGKYVGRPGRDSVARTIYLDNTPGLLSTFKGFISLTVPTDGSAFVLVRARSSGAGYLLGLENSRGITVISALRRDADGKTTVLCSKRVPPSRASGFQRLAIRAFGSEFSVCNSEVGCRGFDREVGEGFFGLETRGGNRSSVFRVEGIDVTAAR